MTVVVVVVIVTVVAVAVFVVDVRVVVTQVPQRIGHLVVNNDPKITEVHLATSSAQKIASWKPLQFGVEVVDEMVLVLVSVDIVVDVTVVVDVVRTLIGSAQVSHRT